MNQLPHFFQDEPIDSANQNAADLCVYKRKTYINYNMMTEGNRDKVWRPPKLFTVYQNACKMEGAMFQACFLVFISMEILKCDPKFGAFLYF